MAAEGKFHMEEENKYMMKSHAWMHKNTKIQLYIALPVSLRT